MEIDHDRRLVLVRFRGTVTPEDLREYLLENWVTGELADYVELADLREIDPQVLNSGALLELARGPRELGMTGAGVRLALLVDTPRQATLATFFANARAIERPDARPAKVFRDLAEAERWLLEPPTEGV